MTDEVTAAAQELRDAVDRTWDVFAGYRVQEPVAVCHHCTTEDRLAQMVATPVREWPDDLLEEHSYAVAVMAIDWRSGYDEGGLVDQLRALLPRYLQTVDDGWLLIKLDTGVGAYGCLDLRTTWTPREVAALDEVLRARLRLAIRRHARSSDQQSDDFVDAVNLTLSMGAGAPLVTAEIERLPTPLRASVVARLRSSLMWADGRRIVQVDGPHDRALEDGFALAAWLLTPERRTLLEDEAAAVAETGDERRWEQLVDGLDAGDI